MAKHHSLESRKDKFVDVLIYAFVGIVSIICIFPFWHVLVKSVSANAAVAARKVTFWPIGFTFEPYQKLFADPSLMRSLSVSIIITVAFTFIGVVITLFAAYPLSRPGLKGRGILTFICMVTLYFAGGMIPDYLVVMELGMLNTLWSLILPLAFSAYNLLIMKTALQATISDSLIESAQIDGANHFRILLQIIVPLSKPILATIALFFAVGRWNAYQDALFYLKAAPLLRPLQLKLYNVVLANSEAIQAEGGTFTSTTNPEVLKAACIMFATFPILLVYPFVQKYFVKGIMIGSVKG